jgi:hypothetical protein
MREFITVDPGELYLPPSRSQGADPGKLARQIARYGNSLGGMPVLQVVRGKASGIGIHVTPPRSAQDAVVPIGETLVGRAKSTQMSPDPVSACPTSHTRRNPLSLQGMRAPATPGSLREPGKSDENGRPK